MQVNFHIPLTAQFPRLSFLKADIQTHLHVVLLLFSLRCDGCNVYWVRMKNGWTEFRFHSRIHLYADTLEKGIKCLSAKYNLNSTTSGKVNVILKEYFKVISSRKKNIILAIQNVAALINPHRVNKLLKTNSI